MLLVFFASSHIPPSERVKPMMVLTGKDLSLIGLGGVGFVALLRLCAKS